jgi:hypothetical protein
VTTGTRAVPSSWLANCATWPGESGQPLCPACEGGYLHPYRVQINLTDKDSGAAWGGVRRLVGWVAVCVGNYEANAAARRAHAAAAGDVSVSPVEPAVDTRDLVDVDGCGFSMPMQALSTRGAGS